jgi:hypothetical protein
MGLVLLLAPPAAGAPGPGLASALALPSRVPVATAPGAVAGATTAAVPSPADSLAGATAAEARAPAAQTISGPPSLLRADRLQHASLSFTLAAGLTVATGDRAAAAGITLALGFAKELWDARREGADLVDLLADVAGAGAALVTVRAGSGRDR